MAAEAVARERLEDADTSEAGTSDEDGSTFKDKQVAREPCISPTVAVMIAVAVGAAVGILFSQTGLGGSKAVTVLALPGKLWLKALKCIVLPMIVLSMVFAMVMLRSLPGARYVGLTVVGLYTLTTVLAATEGCFASVAILRPLVKELHHDPDAIKAPVMERGLLETVLGIFDNLVPKNLVDDAAKNHLLPVIVASIIFGLLIRDKRPDGSESLTLGVLNEVQEVVTAVVTKLMRLTPFGVGSLVFASTARLKLAEVGANVGILIMAVVAGLLFHLFVVYPFLLLLLGGRNPLPYFRNVLPACATALGTSSSAATLPVSTKCAIEGNGITPHIASFVLSLGATINMDGTSIYLICATSFLGALQGVPFYFGTYVLMAILATLCSMGTAPVPSASLVLLATIMTAVNVEMNETFGLITAVDWMLDRLRTVVNVAGDNYVTGIVDAQIGGKHNEELSDRELASDVEVEVAAAP